MEITLIFMSQDTKKLNDIIESNIYGKVFVNRGINFSFTIIFLRKIDKNFEIIRVIWA